MVVLSVITFIVVSIVLWLGYCILTLPSEEEYGRKQQSKAFMKRQQKRKDK